MCHFHREHLHQPTHLLLNKLLSPTCQISNETLLGIMSYQDAQITRKMEADFDVIFVGGGIAGLMGATFAIRAGMKVAILERHSQCGLESTSKNAASFSLHFGSREVCEMAERSAGYFLEPFWSDGGSYLDLAGKVFVARAHQENQTSELIGKLKSNGKPLELIRAEAAAELMSPLGLKIQPGDRYLFDDDHAFIDVPRLVQDLQAYVQGSESMILQNAEVVAIEKLNSNWTIFLKDGNQTITSSAVVISAGANSDAVAKSIGVSSLGLKNWSRTAAWYCVEDAEMMGWSGLPMIHEVDNAFFARPYNGEWFVSPVDNSSLNGGPIQPDLNMMESALASMQRWFERIPLSMHSITAGIRSFHMDGKPKIQAIQDFPGLFWFTALGGYGIKIAPFSADRLTQLLTKFQSSR